MRFVHVHFTYMYCTLWEGRGSNRACMQKLTTPHIYMYQPILPSQVLIYSWVERSIYGLISVLLKEKHHGRGQDSNPHSAAQPSEHKSTRVVAGVHGSMRLGPRLMTLWISHSECWPYFTHGPWSVV